MKYQKNKTQRIQLILSEEELEKIEELRKISDSLKIPLGRLLVSEIKNIIAES